MYGALDLLGGNIGKATAITSVKRPKPTGLKLRNSVEDLEVQIYCGLRTSEKWYSTAATEKNKFLI